MKKIIGKILFFTAVLVIVYNHLWAMKPPCKRKKCASENKELKKLVVSKKRIKSSGLDQKTLSLSKKRKKAGKRTCEEKKPLSNFLKESPLSNFSLSLFESLSEVSVQNHDGGFQSALLLISYKDFDGIAGIDFESLTKDVSGSVKDDIKASLLTKRIDVNQLSKRNKNTLLHFAAQMGNVPFAEVLIELGAFINPKNNDSKTPIDFAQEQQEVSKLLRVHMDLFECAKSNDGKRFQIALDAKPYINVKDHQGNTPLHWIILHEYEDLAQQLFDLDVNVNAQNRDGNTPLHWAVLCSCERMVKLLLSIQKNKVDTSIRNKNGKTALDIARERWNSTIIALLEEASRLVTIY